jgi:hypothetical protein
MKFAVKCLFRPFLGSCCLVDLTTMQFVTFMCTENKRWLLYNKTKMDITALWIAENDRISPHCGISLSGYLHCVHEAY